jgi:hypothetical protein
MLEIVDGGFCLVYTMSKSTQCRMMELQEVYLSEEHDEQWAKQDGLTNDDNHP